MRTPKTRRVNLKRLAKARFDDVSWQHALVRAALPVVDLADWLTRAASPELRVLPRYSMRIRSRGIQRQFGGRATMESTEAFLRFLRERADLQPVSTVLDIGCGCGLTALAMARFLAPGHYIGVDVDRASVDACRASRVLSDARFTFIHAAVHGDVYTGGETPASRYRFPFPDDAFSHIIMCSVVTHLLPAEVENYLREIGRMLRPGGVAVFSTFLTDHGEGRGLYSFPRHHDGYWLMQDDRPRKGVAYDLRFVDRMIAAANLHRTVAPVIGSWRDDPDVPVADPSFSAQDLVVAARPPRR
jgi:SAM-dependent methyltransferase